MSKETQAKERILTAANQLFTKKGYEQVTVREIAKKARCSHTSIYVYFEDKKTLLSALAKEPLERLHKNIQTTLDSNRYTPLEKLIRLSKLFVLFGLSHRNMYEAFLTFEASRVDVEQTTWELNEKRLKLFSKLKQAVTGVLPQAKELELSRMIYFILHGIIMTYKNVNESITGIAKRIFPIVSQSITYLIQGVEVGESS